MSEEIKKELTMEEVLQEARKDYLENLRKRVDFFKSQRREDIKVQHLYEDFKKFNGDFEYLLGLASLKTYQKLVRALTHRIAGDVGHCMRFGDDTQARYYMDKIIDLIELLLKDIDNAIAWGHDLPSMTVKIEPSLPVFFCDQCEANTVKRDSIYNWVPTQEGIGWSPKLSGAKK